MRKTNPIELEMSVSDSGFLQDRINSLFVDIIKYALDNSNTTRQEKVAYIDSVINKLKSD